MTTENPNVNPLPEAPIQPEATESPVKTPLESEEALPPETGNEPPKDDSEKPDEDNQDEKENKDEDTESNSDDESLFAEFIERRKELIESGVDMEALDAKFHNRELGDEDYALLGEKLGYKPLDVKAFIKTKYDVLDLKEKAEAYDAIEKEKAVAVLNEAAGEDYLQLFQYVADKSSPAQYKAWDNLLGNEDPEVQLLAIKQMASFKEAHLKSAQQQLGEQPKEQYKGADLGLLTQSNNSSASSLDAIKQAEQSLMEQPQNDNPIVDENLNQQMASLSWQHLNAICVGLHKVSPEEFKAASIELHRRTQGGASITP